MSLTDRLTTFTDERFFSIYESLAEHGFGPLDAQVAEALKFRPQAIRKLPLEKRARTARKLLERPGQEELAYELLGTFLVRERKDLVTGFLDATGVEHEEGMIEDLETTRPDGAKVADAVKALDGAFDAEDVTLYLALCVDMWPECEEIATALAAR